MFEKYGKMGSLEELNKKAEELSSDENKLMEFALENGFVKEDVEDYLDDGEGAVFCVNVFTAAVARIEVEKEDLKPKEIILDWINYITQCVNEDESIAAAVISKEKSLKECIGSILKWSFENCYKVDPEIVNASGIVKGGVSPQVSMGIPGMARAKKMIREYYMER